MNDPAGPAWRAGIVALAIAAAAIGTLAWMLYPR